MTTTTQALVVVGAGPQALTCVSYLLAERPGLVDELVVVDPRGWLVEWSEQFARLDITSLRSSCVHHPAPQPYALLDFARGRPAELLGNYQRPTAALFADFCASLVALHGLHSRMLAGQAVRLEPRRGGTVVTLASGAALAARRVVVATNPGRPVVPGWAARLLGSTPSDRVVHSSRVDLRGAELAGQRVMVVGGGLTAGGLALAGMARGAQATLVCRRPLHRRTFDTDAGWLTRRELDRFHATTDWSLRRRCIDQARGGGSVTPAVAEALRAAGERGELEVRPDRVTSLSGAACGPLRVAFRHGATVEVDRIWLATGTSVDVMADPLLGDLARRHPVELVGGLPVLDGACRWPGTDVHVMGRLAALQLGPVAGNLTGGRMAAERILTAATGTPPRQYPVPAGCVPEDGLSQTGSVPIR